MKTVDYLHRIMRARYSLGKSSWQEVDCWGLVEHSFKHIDGLELPPIERHSKDQVPELGAIQEGSGFYTEVDQCEGAIICFYAKSGALEHIGRILFGEVYHIGEGMQNPASWPISACIRAYKGRVKYFLPKEMKNGSDKNP